MWKPTTSGGGHFGAQGEGWRVRSLTKRELAVHTEDPRFQPLRSHLHRRVEARQALTGGAPTRFPEAQPESELSPRGHRRQADDNSQALWTAGPRGSGRRHAIVPAERTKTSRAGASLDCVFLDGVVSAVTYRPIDLSAPRRRHAERGSRHAYSPVPPARLNDDHAVDRLARRDGSCLV